MSASFGKRFIAYMIDCCIFFAIGLLCEIFIGKSDLLVYSLNIIFILYFSFMEFMYQATLGKACLKIYVCDKNGDNISFKKALIRNISRILNILTLGIGYLLIIFTTNNQGLHDLIANTFVIEEG